MPSPLTIMDNALRDISAIGAGESSAGGSDATMALSHYNRIINRWQSLSRMSYFEFSQSFTFSVSQPSYTLGITGSGADFVITGAGVGVRPPKINRAKLVITSSSPYSEIDIPVIYVAEYESIPVPLMTGTQPYAVYYKPTFPNGTLYPVPYPTITSNQLKLYFGSQLAQVAMADITTNIDMPPALEDALTFTLSERLCIPYGKEVPSELKIQAAGARQAYSQLNDSDPVFISTGLYGEQGIYDNLWMRSRGQQ